MAKGQMRSNKEKKKPKADKNLKKGGAAPSSVRGRQDPGGRPKPEQQEIIDFPALPGATAPTQAVTSSSTVSRRRPLRCRVP